jgi:acetolactate synthase-1/2/3 large subunit
MMIRVADYIVESLYRAGAEHCFLVTGGMIMHLTDALYSHDSIGVTCCQHEQAATMAGEAYGRFTNKLGFAMATAGPGALNTITGVVGAYVDRSPLVLVAGQSKVSQATVTTTRQFALQGFNNLPIFAHFTKYAVMLTDVKQVRYEVEKCIAIAKKAPVGPVYLECPIDIQASMFVPEEQAPYTEDFHSQKDTSQDILRVAELLKKAKRPLLLAGAGVRLANALDEFRGFVERHQIPTITSRLGMDLIEHAHPLFVGRPGTYGDRPANFSIQNADLLLTVGCRLGMGIVGYGDPKLFGPNAFKVGIDVDPQELSKPSVAYDLAIRMDAKDFFYELNQLSGARDYSCPEWINQTQAWKNKYPVDLPEYENEKEGINSYHFTRLFSEKTKEGDIFVVDTGSCFHVHAQAFQVKKNQRHIITGGLSTMGYAPASIGVAAAAKGKPVFCISGDGSIQMNLQEFQTIAHNKLPVKTILHNNNGYLLIRHTQKNFCGNRLIGEGPDTGVGCPNFKKLADAFDHLYVRIDSLEEFERKIEQVIEHDGPVLCDVRTPAWQLLVPRVASKQLESGKMVSMPYDDMFPFLEREEYQQNCLWTNEPSENKS